MSKKHNPPTPIINFISVIILLGMFVFGAIYIYVSINSEVAAGDIWEHLKSISLIVVGYWFGSVNLRNTNNK